VLSAERLPQRAEIFFLNTIRKFFKRARSIYIWQSVFVRKQEPGKRPDRNTLHASLKRQFARPTGRVSLILRNFSDEEENLGT
jgi:hypothetical protein